MASLKPIIVRAMSAAVTAAIVSIIAPRALYAQTVSPAPPVALEWQAPDECPARADVLAEIARLLGSSPDPRSRDEQLAVRVHIEGDASRGFHLELATGAPESAAVRRIDAPTCQEAAQAAALIVAMVIDPDAQPTPASSPASASPASSEAPSSESPTSSSSPPPSSTAPLPVVRARPRTTRAQHTPRGVALAAVVLDVGTFPFPATGIEAGLGLVIDRWRAEASVIGWVPQTATFDLLGPAGAVLGMTEAGLRGCVAPLMNGIARLDVCSRLHLGAMSGTGLNVPFPTTGSALWGAISAGLAGDLQPIRWLALRASIDGGAAFAIPTFVVSGYGQVQRSSPVFLRAQIGIEVRFP